MSESTCSPPDISHPHDSAHLTRVLAAFDALQDLMAGWFPAGRSLEEASFSADAKIRHAAAELRAAAKRDFDDAISESIRTWEAA